MPELQLRLEAKTGLLLEVAFPRVDACIELQAVFVVENALVGQEEGPLREVKGAEFEDVFDWGVFLDYHRVDLDIALGESGLESKQDKGENCGYLSHGDFIIQGCVMIKYWSVPPAP